jgi:hypothetical protein
MEISHSMYASAPTPLYVGGYEEPVMARRQKKTTHKYYPYQLATTGWWWKWNAISQVAYHSLASVLTKAYRAVQSIIELGCNSCKVNLYWKKFICGVLDRVKMVARNINNSNSELQY